MMLGVLLCWERRRTEPISVAICKKLVVILFVSIALAVLVILSIGVHNDIPTITRLYSSMDQFPVPVVHMDFAYKFNITCNIIFATRKKAVGCNEYVIQPYSIIEADNSTTWRGGFSPVNLSFTSDINNTTISQINLLFTITDPSYNIAVDGVYRFNASTHDQEYDPFNDPLADVSENYSIFVKSLQGTVFFNTGSQYTLKISRKQREILRDSFLNDLGLPRRYPSQPYIVVNDRFYSTTAISSAIFRISPLTFALETETEQRNKNALSVISNVLAVWGGLTAFYIFLFGTDSIRPWGFVQERIFKSEIHNKLRSAPFSKNVGSPEERIEALEAFLKDYVVNVNVSLTDYSNRSSYNKINESS